MKRTIPSCVGVAVFLLCAVQTGVAADAPPSVSIAGPDEIAAGNLATLIADSPTATSFAWVVFPFTKNFYVDSSRRAAVLCGDGSVKEYNVILSVIVDGQIAMAQKCVAVGALVPPSPTPPLPEPDVPLSKFSRQIKEWAESTVSDPGRFEEAQKLATVYDVVIAKIAAGTLTEVDEIIKTTFDASRAAVPRFTAWQEFGEKLRGQLNANFEAGILKTPADHVSHWKAIAAGLKAVR